MKSGIVWKSVSLLSTECHGCLLFVFAINLIQSIQLFQDAWIDNALNFTIILSCSMQTFLFH